MAAADAAHAVLAALQRTDLGEYRDAPLLEALCLAYSALHALLDDVAPQRPLKVKRVDGQCEACYAAHVALAARLRALKNPKAKGAAGGDVDA